MRELLAALQQWPDVDIHALRTLAEWDQAQSWGWIMESGELTGSGWRHVHDLPGGLIVE